MIPALDEIQQIARQITESERMELVDIEYKPGGKRSLLRIFIDKLGGVTLQDCENVSRQLSAILDVKDLVNSAYVLEVSSPGLDRPLVTDNDYRRSIGRIVRVRYVDESGNLLEATGKLQTADDESIHLETGGHVKEIFRNQIKKVVQEILLGQPKKARKGQR